MVESDDDCAWLQIWFATATSSKSKFRARIAPSSFKHLAQLMIAADPREAIKAFSAAMQEVPEIPRSYAL